MNKIFYFITLFFLLSSQTFAIIGITDLKCFREVSVIQKSNLSESMYFVSNKNDILIQQDNKTLSITFYDNTYKYIPYSVNISQTEISDDFFKSRYDLGDIDSDILTDIILELQEPVEENTFTLDFNYDSQYYTPSYYISEDGENYSQVLRRDISDYTLKKLKISFRPKGDEPIREIIKISQLALKRNGTIFQISGIDTSKNLEFYQSNSCGQTRDAIQIGSGEPQKIHLNTLLFQENILYTKNTSDSDGDGVSDLDDNCINVKNSDQVDINQNNIGDVCEFDSDNDSIPDEIDNCRNIANTDQKDDDKDGIGNLCDNCNVYNPSQTDTNDNSIGDVCDARKSYLESNDDDRDGVENSRDNCKEIANSDQKDSDNDGVGDMCDNCKAFQNTDQKDENENGVGDICEDSDKDGIESLTDNCMNTPNPDQKDDDNDGVGNLCEDDDYDSIILIDDNCPYTNNPDQRDTDSDGLGDACDENDNRFLESNKTIFIILLIIIIGVFLSAIYMMSQKLKK